MSLTYDVKVSRDRLYVLCPLDSLSMNVLTLKGDKLHSFITCCEGMDVLEPSVLILTIILSLAIADLTYFVSFLEKVISYTR